MLVGIQGENDIRTDATRTSLHREMVRIPLRIETRRIHATAEVGLREAPIALLHVLPQVLRGSSRRVARQHSEALRAKLSVAGINEDDMVENLPV